LGGVSNPSQSSRRRRVLVVEDEEEVQILVGRILQSAGHEVETALDGAEAIRKIERNVPDLIILDLLMPGVDGWSVLDHLSQRHQALPIVVLTGRSDPESFRRGISSGAIAFVTKPFRFHELLATCQRVLLTTGSDHDIAVERRNEPRRTLLVEVSVLSREHQPIAVGELLNLSSSGACIELAVPIDIGERVRVSMRIPRGHSPHLEGEVRWRRAAARGMSHGLAFVDISSEDEEYLKDLLRPIK
jgi:CheY-like chemotaxis protein